jgi:hypothetical protein
VRTVRHFFPDLNDGPQGLPDTRAAGAITYPARFLAWWGIALYLLQLRSRRQLNFKLDARGTHVLDNLNRLAGTGQQTRPVEGALDHFVGHVAAGACGRLCGRLVRHLIRSRVLEPARLQGYLVAAGDGTGLYACGRRHCGHGLVQRHDSGSVYLHQVLEAKLLGSSNVALSIGSAFIENDGAQAAAAAGRRSAEAVKQDCAWKAFSRLAPPGKQAFPQLRLCWAVDALYACGRFLQACRDHGWSYVVTLKPKDLPAAGGEFERLLPLCPRDVLERTTAEGVHRVCRWVHDLSYVDSEGREWRFPGIRLEETVAGETTTFARLTPLHVSAETVEEVVWRGGRPRWKIENQGFNRQKNSGLNLQHLCSTDPEKRKAYYYLLQTAFTLLALLERGGLRRRLAAAGGRTPWQLLGGLMTVAWLLLESLRRDRWAAGRFDGQAAGRLHVGFQAFGSS